MIAIHEIVGTLNKVEFVVDKVDIKDFNEGGAVSSL